MLKAVRLSKTWGKLGAQMFRLRSALLNMTEPTYLLIWNTSNPLGDDFHLQQKKILRLVMGWQLGFKSPWGLFLVATTKGSIDDSQLGKFQIPLGN